MAAGGAPLAVLGQATTELITTELPYPVYRSVTEDHYGFKVGAVRLRFDASVSAIFTDNRNLAVDGDEESDYGLRPVFNAGMFYPVNDRQKIQIDVGMGYQWWANNSGQNRFYVSPNSHVDYAFQVGDVAMRLANNTSSSSEAATQAEFAGGRDPLDVEFHRINNATSLLGTWAGSRRLSLSGGYTFSINRSLTDQFQFIDRDTHAVNGSALVRISAPLSAGISGNYSTFSYTESFQNDGQSYSVGPSVTWQPTDALRFNAYGHYSQSFFEMSGATADQSEFTGIVYGVTGTYTMNRYMTHDLSVGKNVNPGFRSNFTEELQVRYGLAVAFTSRLRSTLSFQYRLAEISGTAGESADLYQVSVGTGYQVLERANVGLVYSLSSRTSDQAERDYLENRLTLTASYRF